MLNLKFRNVYVIGNLFMDSLRSSVSFKTVDLTVLVQPVQSSAQPFLGWIQKLKPVFDQVSSKFK